MRTQLGSIAAAGAAIALVLAAAAPAVADPVNPPTVTVNQAATQPDPTATSPIVFDIVFSEPVTGLTPADFSSSGTTAGGILLLDLAGSGAVYSASVSGMTTAGDVVLSLPAGAAVDAFAHLSLASTSTDNTVAWSPPPPDTTAPTVTVNQGAAQADPTATSPIVYDIVFSEPVTGLTPADFSSTGTTAGGILLLDLTGSGTTYTASVSGMTTAGDVVLSLPAGATTDAAGNFSAASTATDNTVAWSPPPPDTTAPTSTVNQGAAQADPTATSPIVYDIVFSEPVTGLTPADFSSTGTTAGGILLLDLSGSGTSYTASISGMTTGGDVVLSLPAGAATDAAGNFSAASTATDDTVAWDPSLDATPPTVVVEQASTQADPTSSSPIRFEVVFSEPVTGFDAADVSTAGSTAGGPLAMAVSGTGSAYVIAVSGMTSSGAVTVAVAAAAAVDAVGNASLASTSTDAAVQFVVVPPSTAPPTSAPPSTGPPTVPPSSAAPTASSGVAVGSSGRGPTSRGLPATGADPGSALLAALALLAVGAGLVARRMRTVRQP